MLIRNVRHDNTDESFVYLHYDLFFSEAERHPVTGILFGLAKRKERLLWLQVINRAARSVGDEGTESSRMKDSDEIHPTISCCCAAEV